MKKVVPLNAHLIPESAEKVFEGILFDVYQWPQTMFDGSIKTFEMLRRVDTAMVLAVKGGKVVTVEVRQPGVVRDVFDFPGGRNDKHDTDETMLAVAQRELEEETGLSFAKWCLVHVQQVMEKIEGFYYWYVADELVSEQAPNYEVEGENISTKLMTIEEIKRHIDTNPDYAYLLPIFRDVHTIKDLVNLPEFKGQEIDRN